MPNVGDVAADEGWYLLARVTYSDPEGADPRGLRLEYRPTRCGRTYPTTDNNSPDFNQDTTTRTVPEDRGVGMTVGAASGRGRERGPGHA